MGSRRSTAWGAFALVLAWVTSAAAQDMHIQFAEKVAIAAALGHTEFDAYGRRFALDLQSNDRLLKTLVANRKLSIDSSRLLRGKLAGVAGSWVRLARVGDGLEGAIWDGHDLYIVTSKQRIAASLTLPIDGATSQLVIYRLSDVFGVLPKVFCGVAVHLPASPVQAKSGLAQYQAMVSELRANAAGLAADEQLDVSLVADTDFQAKYGTESRDEMLAQINTVDGIFGEQVGVLLVPTEFRLVASGSDPFNTTDPEVLLGQVAAYRSASPGLEATGVTHLLTGKKLDGSILGVAYLDSLCDPGRGVSLSSSKDDQFAPALVMAHEFGHNFGAPHDGVAGSACAAEPQTYLMAPALNYSSVFSQCSLANMRTSIARARGVCIKPLEVADLALQLPDPGANQTVTFNAGEEFAFPVVVHSIGNVAATNASVRLELPSQVSVQSAVAAGGSCSQAGIVLTCQLGTLAPGEDRAIDLRLLSNTLGTYFVNGSVSADNDFVQTNNSAFVYLGLQSAVDLSVAIAASAAEVYEGDTIDFTVDVSSLRTQTAHGAVLSVSTGGMVESFDAGANACAIQTDFPTGIRCTLADLPAGATTRITVRARADSPRVYFADTTVTVQNDGDYSNDNARVSYTSRAEREIVTTVSSESLRVVAGSTNEIVYTLASVGRLSAGDVTLVVGAPGDAIQSVVPSAGICAPPAPGLNYICSFGTLNPGETRTVTVRFQAGDPGQLSLLGLTDYTAGTAHRGSSAFTQVFVNVRVDASASFFTAVQVLEGQTGTGTFELRSEGIDPAQNVVATLDVPAPIRLTALRMVYNPQGFQCTIVSAQRATCTGSFAQAPASPAVTRVEYDFISDTAIDAHPVLTLSADGDEIASNNTAQSTLTVSPVIQIDLASTSTQVVIVAGRVTPFDFTFSTGRNAVHNAYVSVSGSSPWYAIESITFNNADCPRAAFDTTTFGRFVCTIGDLPGNASYPVTVKYRGYQGGVSGGMYISAGAQGTDRDLSLGFNAANETDVQVQVAQATASATNGAQLRYPLITVWSMGSLAYGVDVDIPLPAFASIATVSSNGTCTGTTTLHCHYNGIGGGTGETIDILLNTSATGTFTSNITASAGNDFTAANNTSSVALTVTATSGGGSSSSGSGSSSGGGSVGGGGSSKGGGGGRMEWLALAMLGMLTARRMRRRGAMPHPAHATRH